MRQFGKENPIEICAVAASLKNGCQLENVGPPLWKEEAAIWKTGGGPLEKQLLLSSDVGKKVAYNIINTKKGYYWNFKKLKFCQRICRHVILLSQQEENICVIAHSNALFKK